MWLLLIINVYDVIVINEFFLCYLFLFLFILLFLFVLLFCYFCRIDFIIPQRVVLSIMGFFAIVNAYTMRICLNVAITEMTIKKHKNASVDQGICVVEGGSNSTVIANHGTFDWDEELQGIILGAFFWGYVS